MKIAAPPTLNGSSDQSTWNSLNNWLSVLHSAIGGAFTHRFFATKKTTTTTLRVEEFGIIFVDTTSGAFTVTLPPVMQAGNGAWYWIFKTDVTASTATIAGNASDKINGAATYTGINGQYKGALFLTDGVGWFVLATI